MCRGAGRDVLCFSDCCDSNGGGVRPSGPTGAFFQLLPVHRGNVSLLLWSLRGEVVVFLLRGDWEGLLSSWLRDKLRALCASGNCAVVTMMMILAITA